MEILIIDNLEPRDAEFNQPLYDSVEKIAKASSTNYRSIPSIDMLNKRYAGVIISGAPLHYPNEVIDSRISYLYWIQEITIPVLGICLGHQNIARIFGGKMIVDKEKENGSYSLTVLRNDPLLVGIETGDQISELHSVSVTLPSEFQQLACTATCRNQVMKHATKEIYGVQFHPELSQTGQAILHNFIKLCKIVPSETV